MGRWLIRSSPTHAPRLPLHTQTDNIRPSDATALLPSSHSPAQLSFNRQSTEPQRQQQYATVYKWHGTSHASLCLPSPRSDEPSRLAHTVITLCQHRKQERTHTDKQTDRQIGRDRELKYSMEYHECMYRKWPTNIRSVSVPISFMIIILTAIMCLCVQQGATLSYFFR